MNPTTMNSPIDRRLFLKQTGAAGVGLSLASYFGPLARAGAQPKVAPGRKIGPNDKITAAVIGTNGRGLAHIDCLTSLPGVEITHICDVDKRAVAKGIKATAKKQDSEPQGLGDFRKVLVDPSIDVVTIATPDHWHTPMAILAMAAGKHVYVEKPCSQNPYEGELLLQAVNKYQRVVQMGAQRRSFPLRCADHSGNSRWPDREDLFWPWLVCQQSRQHRPRQTGTGAGMAGLRTLARPGSTPRLHR